MESKQELIDFIEDGREKFYKIAFAYVKNREDALDILHNAIVKALQKHRTLRNPAYLETWFYRILINESISMFRRNKRTAPLEEAPEAVDLSDRSEYMDLYEALDRLPVKLKSVVILRYFEDRKLSEIAEITSANLSTTKSRLYKALKLLKTDLEDTENDR